MVGMERASSHRAWHWPRAGIQRAAEKGSKCLVQNNIWAGCFLNHGWPVVVYASLLLQFWMLQVINNSSVLVAPSVFLEDPGWPPDEVTMRATNHISGARRAHDNFRGP